MSAHPMTEAHGKPMMRTFVRICNDGPMVDVRQDHLCSLLYLRLVYTVFTGHEPRRILPTQKGYQLAGQLHEGRDYF